MEFDIEKLSREERVDLNHRVVARLRFLVESRAHSAMLEFRVGDRVSFDAEGREPVFGVLTKYNRKTVTVITEGGEHWNVSPTFLKKANPATDRESGPNVIPFARK